MYEYQFRYRYYVIRFKNGSLFLSDFGNLIYRHRTTVESATH